VPESASSLVVGGFTDAPPVFAGPPEQLSGRVHLHNPGGASVVLRDAGLKDDSGVLRLPSARHVLHPFVVRPDQGRSLELTIAVDPATPSGEYKAELEVAGQWLPVVLCVAEVLEAKVQPHTLVVFNRTGVAQRRRLLVTNTGNLPFALGDPGPVELRKDTRRGDLVRVGVEPILGGERADLEGAVAALMAVARAEPRPAGSLVVRAPGGPVEVRPGESAFVELELTVEKELPEHERFRGWFPILSRDVDVVVVPPGTNEPPAPRETRARRKPPAPLEPPAPRRPRRRAKTSNDPQGDQGAAK